jgi:two-component system, OmpR family, response regulator CpxR
MPASAPEKSNAKPASRVLVVDDDVGLCELVAEYLVAEGFPVECVHNGESGIERALSGEHAIAILDVMLPGISGFDVLRRLRTKSRLPVLMLTARGEDIDRIVGLEIGADDYLPKPFNPRELVARIRAVLRRTSPDDEHEAYDLLAVGDVEMDLGTRTVRRDGEMIDLTVVEYDILDKLLRSPGRIVTRQSLVKDVLGRVLSPFDRSIDMHISNLRKKLGHVVDGVERIKTVRGVGYIYQAEARDLQAESRGQRSEVSTEDGA